MYQLKRYFNIGFETICELWIVRFFPFNNNEIMFTTDPRVWILYDLTQPKTVKFKKKVYW